MSLIVLLLYTIQLRALRYIILGYNMYYHFFISNFDAGSRRISPHIILSSYSPILKCSHPKF